MDQIRVVTDPGWPEGEIGIVSLSPTEKVCEDYKGFTLCYPKIDKAIRITNIDTKLSYGDWNIPVDDPEVEQTTWQRSSWLLVLGIIAFPILLALLYGVHWIISNLT